MPEGWKTVRVFISSTFRDMHAERDQLVRVVFPELRERCAKRRLHLVDVDLRWGVTEQDAQRGKALEICLREIEDCRPFFVGILGERYGYVPPTYDVSDEEEFDWVRSTELGLSITAMEIYHGVLNNPEMRAHAFFYFRSLAFIDTLPEEQQADFRAESPQHAEKLAALKANIRTSALPVMEDYHYDELESFGKQVLEDLWGAIQAQHPQHAPEPDPLDGERAYHDFFIETRTQLFIGQRHLLGRLHEYATGDASGPMVLSGTPGCGKSALLAKFVDQFRRLQPEVFCLYHFIGTSPTSTDPRRMLLRLCQELARRFELDEEIPQEYAPLRVAFWQMLERVAEEHRVVLVIDALDQLDETHRSQELDWLPALVPAGLRLIVSSLEGDTLEGVRRKCERRQEMLITSLRLVDQGFIIARQLAQSRKRLTTARKYRQWRAERLAQGQQVPADEDRSQLRYILAGVYSRQCTPTPEQAIQRETANPLYLKLVAEELRLFGRFDRLEQFIAELPTDVPGMFHAVLDRLEEDHGKRLVERSLALITTGRHGLLEGELLDLLARPGEDRFPLAFWSRLYRNVAFYMKPRSSLGGGPEGLIDFFHRELAKVVTDRYLDDARVATACHRVLATYFQRKGDPGGDGTWQGNYPRSFSELPHHQVMGELWSPLLATLTDLQFLAAKITHYPVVEILKDMRRALNSMPLEAVAPKQRAQHEFIERSHAYIRTRTSFFLRFPRMLVANLLSEMGAASEGASSRTLTTLSRVTVRRTRTGGEAHRAWHRKRVLSVDLSTDGSLLATASEDWTVKLWRAAALEPIYTVSLPSYAVFVCFLQGGKQMVAVPAYGPVHHIDVQSGEVLDQFDDLWDVWHAVKAGPSRFILCGWLRSPSGALVRALSADKQDRPRGDRPPMRGSDMAARGLGMPACVSPDGVWGASARIQVWDLGTGQVAWEADCGGDGVAFVDDDSFAVGGRSVVLWSAPQGVRVGEIELAGKVHSLGGDDAHVLLQQMDSLFLVDVQSARTLWKVTPRYPSILAVGGSAAADAVLVSSAVPHSDAGVPAALECFSFAKGEKRWTMLVP